MCSKGMHSFEKPPFPLQMCVYLHQEGKYIPYSGFSPKKPARWGIMMTEGSLSLPAIQLQFSQLFNRIIAGSHLHGPDEDKMG